MKLPNLPLSLLVVSVCLISAAAQKSRSVRSPEIGKAAVVIDESLSLLRTRPSLYADAIQRMRRGRRVQILGVTDADGVRFLKVAAPRSRVGWIQADAVFGKFRSTDEDRFARLVQVTDGFDRIQLAAAFLQTYPASRFRPVVLLLFGDLAEDAAVKLSRDANSRLSQREMIASGAPVHSYFLNFNALDRYRRIGVTFLFNPATRRFHYNGASWGELLKRHAGSTEAVEAERRLDSLREKMEKGTS